MPMLLVVGLLSHLLRYVHRLGLGIGHRPSIDTLLTFLSFPFSDATQLGRILPPDTEVPSSLESDDYRKFAPAFTLEVPAGHVRDQNTEDTLFKVEKVFAGYLKVLQARYAKPANGLQ